MKYFPVLRNRQVEMKSFDKIMNNGNYKDVYPIIEMILNFRNNNARENDVFFLEELLKKNIKGKFFIDIARLKPSTNTAKNVYDDMLDFQKEEYYKQTIDQILKFDRAIPIISFNNHHQFNNAFIQKIFAKIEDRVKAVRIHADCIDSFDFSILNSFGTEDYIFFDIGENDISNPIYEIEFLPKLNKLDSKKVIICSPRHKDFTHAMINNGKVIKEINNSLKKKYLADENNYYGYGDYAGINNALPSSGGIISPAAILYHPQHNVFYGYHKFLGYDSNNLKIKHKYTEYEEYIIPSILKSNLWSHLSDNHKVHCPGCSYIVEVATGPRSGKSMAAWKGVTMDHYIYSIAEQNKKR